MTPNASRTTALLAGLLALAAAAVTWDLLAEGMRTMGAEAGRPGAVAALLVACELAAWGGAALLPRSMYWQRLGLGLLGAALLVLSVTGMTAAHRAATAGADATASATEARVAHLEAEIAAKRAQAEAARGVAERQRANGGLTAAAQTMQRAAGLDADAAALAGRLADVQGQRRPTLTLVMGEQGAATFAAARSALVALAGMLLASTAGALLRHAGQPAPVVVAAPEPPRAAAPVVPRVTRWAAALPAAALAASPVAVMSAPVQQPQQPKPAAPQAADRYAQAVDAVRSGCKPSTRELQRALGCSPATAGALLKQLAAAGVIRAAGRGYEAA